MKKKNEKKSVATKSKTHNCLNSKISPNVRKKTTTDVVIMNKDTFLTMGEKFIQENLEALKELAK